MKIKTFRAKTMADALREVKKQLGRDAIILSTRTDEKGGLWGLASKGFVEITAAKDLSDLPPPLASGTFRASTRRSNSADGAAKRMSRYTQSTLTPHEPGLRIELDELKSLVADLVRETRKGQTQRLPDKLFDHYERLVESEVAQSLAQQIVQGAASDLDERQLADPVAVRAYMLRALESSLPTADPIQLVDRTGPTLIALVGPTGVGKTTTIAKLAANYCLREGKKVGLITIDTYRIAAVEQLKTYARIIDVPLEVALSPQQLSESVSRLADRDVILIDTAGRGQRDSVKIEELRSFFDLVRPHEVHLVLSSTSAQSVLDDAITRFASVGIDRVLFTKLDEAIGFGVMVTCLEKAGADLSYVTTGQDVPDDLEVGNGRALAELILGERKQEGHGKVVDRSKSTVSGGV